MADKPCDVADCAFVGQLRRGFCKPHYRRFMRFGDPLVNNTARGLSPEDRLRHHGWTERLVVSELGVCWIWGGGRRSRKPGVDYGGIRVDGVETTAHRLAYEVWVGPIPDGHLIRHKCDNPPCMNPAHLSTGTVRDNSRDMLERGRHKPPQGSKNGQSLLSDEDVVTILARIKAGDVQATIARDYGVSNSTVSMIKRGLRWGYLVG